MEKRERRERAAEVVKVDVDGYGLGDDVFRIRG
jgi:hypothetical protein